MYPTMEAIFEKRLLAVQEACEEISDDDCFSFFDDEINDSYRRHISGEITRDTYKLKIWEEKEKLLQKVLPLVAKKHWQSLLEENPIPLF